MKRKQIQNLKKEKQIIFKKVKKSKEPQQIFKFLKEQNGGQKEEEKSTIILNLPF